MKHTAHDDSFHMGVPVACRSLNESVTAEQQRVCSARDQLADVLATERNAVHDVIGSFADGHSTL